MSRALKVLEQQQQRFDIIDLVGIIQVPRVVSAILIAAGQSWAGK